MHGPMKWRPGLDWWECLGFDGEGCGVQIIYIEDVERCGGGHIPGVRISTPGGFDRPVDERGTK